MNQSNGNRPTLLLTGGSGIFGRAFIRKYSDEYIIISIVNNNKLPSNTSYSRYELSSKKHEQFDVKQIECDLTNPEMTRQVLNVICETCDDINLICNAAADTRFYGETWNILEYDDESRNQMYLNSIAPAFLTSIVFNKIWKSRTRNSAKPSVLNISSISGLKPFIDTNQAVYAASKAALNMMTIYMSAEYRKFGIGVNGYAPSPFSTDEQADVVASKSNKILKSAETGRIFTD